DYASIKDSEQILVRELALTLINSLAAEVNVPFHLFLFQSLLDQFCYPLARFVSPSGILEMHVDYDWMKLMLGLFALADGLVLGHQILEKWDRNCRSIKNLGRKWFLLRVTLGHWSGRALCSSGGRLSARTSLCFRPWFA